MKNILLTIIVTSIWTLGQACDCSYTGNFLKVSKHVEMIAIVKVTQYNDYFLLTAAATVDINQPQSVTFEIVKVLKGNDERKQIKVFGDNGFQCRPYVDIFKKDKFYIVGLFKCRDHKWENGIIETIDDYSISNCGDYWIEYLPDNKKVKGVIDKKKRKPTIMTFDKFETLLADD